MSPHGAAELRELMEIEGVFAGEVMEFSAGPELLIYAGSFAGGLAGLAAVLRAYFHRNQHKSTAFSYGDDSVEVKGYSDEETDRLIENALETMRQKQLERDEEWRRLLGREPKDDG